MMSKLCLPSRLLLAGILTFTVTTQFHLASAETPATSDRVYAFNGTNGSYPEGPTMITDGAGNFYGTTTSGGKSGDGTVFKVTSAGVETVLYSFTGGSDGSVPIGSVLRDKAGNLYGTALHGGNAACACGTVWQISAAGTFKVLHTFTGSDGASPFAGLIADAQGNLYGTTEFGGSGNTNCGSSGNGGGCGVVFKVTPQGNESVIYNFQGYQVGDGYNPEAPLVMDSKGVLYGTTFQGGTAACICGTIFSVTTSGTETVLYSFTQTDGNGPVLDPLAMDSAGNLYGTTDSGGADNFGVVFKFNASTGLTVLHSFTNGNDGGAPFGGVILDSAGNLYGTTSQSDSFSGYGLVYELAPSGTETVLYNFKGGTDGIAPYGGLLALGKNLIGTTLFGGHTTSSCISGCGTVFAIAK